MKKSVLAFGVLLLVTSNLSPIIGHAATALNDESIVHERSDLKGDNESSINSESSMSEVVDGENERLDSIVDQSQQESDTIENEELQDERIQSQIPVESDSTRLDNASKTSIVESGTFGTSNWTLDDSGVVHFSAGEFIDSYPPGSTNNSPIFPEEVRGQVKEIIFDGPIIAKGSNHLFASLTSLTTVTNANLLDMSSVDTMKSMFAFDFNLTNIDVSNWDVSSVTNMSSAFYGINVTTLDVANWNVSSVTNMQQLFASCKLLQTVDVSKWDVSSVKNMSSLFSQFQGSELTSLDVSNWDVSSATNMSELFKGNPKLTNLDLSNWNVSSATTMARMFAEDATLTNLDISNWNVSSVSDMSKMFSENAAETSFDISNWDISSVTNMSEMFAFCDNLNSINLNYTRNGSATINTSGLLDFYTDERRIKQITIGADTVLTDAKIHPLVANGQYTEKWQDIGTGTADRPLGVNEYTSDELNSGTPIVPGTYVWQPMIVKGADVTVHYQDEQGNSLLPDEVLTGDVGESYTATQKNIPNYTFKEVQGTPSGKFTDKEQMVTYVYERTDAAPVTVKYEDENGNELGTSEELNGKIGLPYQSQAKSIVGYTVKTTPTNASGLFTDQAQEVVYVYERTTAAPVTVKYEDKDGNELAKSDELSGKIGLAYQSQAKSIVGYTVKTTPTNANGLFTDKAQTVTYIYTKDSVKGMDVTIRYQDEDGNEIASEKIVSGNIGDSYTSEQLNIKNYTFKEVQGDKSGHFTDKEQLVIYIYTKESNGVIVSPEPIPTPKPQPNPTIDASVPVYEVNTDKESLPQAGERENSSLVVIGELIVICGIILGRKKFKQANEK